MNKINTVSIWEGQLVWVDNPRSGKSKKGNEWKSVDFTIKYTDSQDRERHISFNTFGAEKVDKILNATPGTKIRVAWVPDSHEYNGRWYTKLDAYDITILGQEATSLPENSPSFQQEGKEIDLPF